MRVTDAGQLRHRSDDHKLFLHIQGAVFLRLGKEILPKEVNARWRTLLDAEAQIIQAQPRDPGIHSGAGPR